MTKKEVLDFKPAPRLEQIATYIASKWRIASIISDDALILLHRANPGGWNFREPQRYADATWLYVDLMPSTRNHN